MGKSIPGGKILKLNGQGCLEGDLTLHSSLQTLAAVVPNGLP